MTEVQGIGGCPHCPSRAECACPTSVEICPSGACVCGPNCPCRIRKLPDPPGCLGRLFFLLSWAGWLVAVVGLIGTIVAVVDGDARIAAPWFWIFLLLLLSLGIFGFGWLLLVGVRPEPEESPPEPQLPTGCLSPLVWSGLFGLLMIYLLGSIVWLLGDADTAGGRWTLLPIGLAVMIVGIGIWVWRHRIESSFAWILSAALLIALLVGLIGLGGWFTGGRADDSDEPSRTDSIVEPEGETTDETSSTGSTPVVTNEVDDPDPDPVADPNPVTEPEPTGTPLPEHIATLLARQCAAVMSGLVDDLTVEALFPEPERATRPADSVAPPLHANPPAALEIMYLGAFNGGCGDTAKLIVVAYLGGPPIDVQLAVALDLFEGAGHVAEPDASEKIPQIGGWDRFAAYDEVNGLFYSDGEFRAVDESVEVDMEGDVFAFIVDRDGVDMVDVNFQTFIRDSELAGSPTDWQYAGIHHEF